jgi:DNA helicase-2/ATP-dependent DNA helicase PcrA
MSVVRMEGLKPQDCKASRLEALVEDYGITLHERSREKLQEIVQRALTTSIMQANDGLIDFDDQIYMPAMFGAPFDDFDIVLIDEAQDVSPIQMKMLKRVTHNPFGKSVSKLIAVGDPFQSIYAFRGADSYATEKLIAAWNCKEMNLSVCFRCKSEIIRVAKQFVPEIEAAEDGGLVAQMNGWDVDSVPPGSAVLCRLNAPLVINCLRFISRGRSAVILGKDIEKGLVSLIKKADTNNLRVLPERLNNIYKRESEKLLAKGKTQAVGLLEDKIEAILAAADSLPPTAAVKDLEAKLKTMFSKEAKKQAVTFSTVHKAKGKEWNTVFILDPFYMPSKYATSKEDLQQEDNMIYVATTRAKEKLFYIKTEEFGACENSG